MDIAQTNALIISGGILNRAYPFIKSTLNINLTCPVICSVIYFTCQGDGVSSENHFDRHTDNGRPTNLSL